jgi:hypothetical protein
MPWLSDTVVGYGFLSEKSAFVHALDAAGLTFIGPSEPSMAAMGDKIESKKLAHRSGVNTIPGFEGAVRDVDHALEIGKYTVLSALLVYTDIYISIFYIYDTPSVIYIVSVNVLSYVLLYAPTI